MPTFNFQLYESIKLPRMYEFNRDFPDQDAALAFLQEIVDSGQIPDHIQEENNELIYESEYATPAINGTGNDFPGLWGSIEDEGNPMKEVPYARPDTSMQVAFTWIHDGKQVLYRRLDEKHGALSGNVVIATPTKQPSCTWGETPQIGTRFYTIGDGRTWEVLFVFEQPKSKKRFNVQYNVGKVKYLLNFHDGVKTHTDGSDFFDIRTFKNLKLLNTAIAELKADGYAEM